MLELVPQDYGYDVRVKGRDGHSIGICQRSDDGFFYFDAIRLRGLMASYTLREIADLLDELNKPWNDKINEYFDTQSENT